MVLETFFKVISVLQNEAEISVFRGREMCSVDQNKINVFRGEKCSGDQNKIKREKCSGDQNKIRERVCECEREREREEEKEGRGRDWKLEKTNLQRISANE